MDGTPFGRYQLVELLGRGGMGEVWRAYDNDTRRTVAIKLLPTSFASDPEFAERFRREAYAAASLNDPHVVPIHHFGEIDGRLYVDMRLVDGRDLAQVLEDGPLEPARATAIVGQVASALAAAHRIGLVHRDVKPSNVLLTEDDFAYLIDFGIARAADETSLTNSGVAIGTADYMAPERLNAELGDADHRVDVYALACILFQCLTGERPFRGEGFAQIATAQLFTPPPRPSARLATLPVAMDDVIAKGMAKNPHERYGTARELATAARNALAAGEHPAPPTVQPQAPPTRQAPVESNPVGAYSYPMPHPPQPPTRSAPLHYDAPPPGWGGQPAKPTNRKPLVLGIVAFVVVVLVGGTVIALVTRSTGSDASDTTSKSEQWREPGVTSAADVLTLLASAEGNARAAKSAKVDMSVTGTIAGFPTKKLDGDVTAAPAPASQGTMNMFLAGTEITDVRYVVIDGTFYGTLTSDVWTDFGPAANIFDPTAFLSPTVGVVAILTAFTGVRITGDETIDGLATTRIEGVVSADAVNGLFPAVKAAGPVPTTAWVDPGTQQLVQLELRPSGGSSIQLNLSEWGKPVTVTKPAV